MTDKSKRHYYAAQSPRGFANEIEVHRFPSKADRDAWVEAHEDDGDMNAATQGAYAVSSAEAREILGYRGDEATKSYNGLTDHPEQDTDDEARLKAVKAAIKLAARYAEEDADRFSMSIRWDDEGYTAVARFAYDQDMTLMVDGDAEAVAKILAGDEGAIGALVDGYDDDWIEEAVPSPNGGWDWIQRNMISI